MRAVLDPNVLISALISPSGAPAALLRGWADGAFDMVVSPLLLAELRRALAYPKLRERVLAAEAARVLAWLEDEAVFVKDPPGPPPVRSLDPGDDYLITLASAADAVLVSGDRHLLDVTGDVPIRSVREFGELLNRE